MIPDLPGSALVALAAQQVLVQKELRWAGLPAVAVAATPMKKAAMGLWA
jgi:hypothetical protein